MAARLPTWGMLFTMPPTMTAEDLLLLPDDSAKNELYEGTVVCEEITGPGHGDICQRLGVELGIYVRAVGFRNRIFAK